MINAVSGEGCATLNGVNDYCEGGRGNGLGNLLLSVSRLFILINSWLVLLAFPWLRSFNILRPWLGHREHISHMAALDSGYGYQQPAFSCCKRLISSVAL